MWRQLCGIVLAVAAAIGLSGCGGVRGQWEVAVENQSPSTCSIYVTMDYANGGGQGTSEAKVEGMAAGEKSSLIVGQTVQTIRSIKVVRGQEEQMLTPNAELRPGSRYIVVVPAEGNVEASFEEGD